MSLFALVKSLSSRSLALDLPSIGVLSSNTCVLAVSRNIDALEQDISGVGHKVVPLRRVTEVQRTNSTSIEPNDSNQHRTKNKSINGIEVIPDLAVSIKGTATVNIDILSTQLEESSGILVDLGECILLPVVCVVCEGHVSLDIYSR